MRIDHPSNRLVENVLFTLFLDMASKRSNYKDFEWAIKLNRCSFKIIGLWPENHEVINTNNFVSNIQASFIFIMVTLVLVIPFTWSLVRVWSDMILMIENLQLTLPLIFSCLKLLIMRWKRSAILLIVNMMAEDWMHLSTEAERYIIISNETSYISFSRICAAICGTVSSLVILLFYCIGGELVAKECEAVYRALCDLEWYILEPTESRALILIMIRTSKFFCITAGKIFPLSMATFCSVFKTSVGYISFLLAKRN
ncbi:uncharacterized protein [Linepithema humile]|uniref:uncharacterized protein isoform X3 n=1 Tax=Linepithema humile TaxID=83485 RepID=UPI00351DF611